MNDLVKVVEPDNVWTPSIMMSRARFNELMTWAEVLSKSSLVPPSLRQKGSGDRAEDLPPEQILANVFLVCEQADRWRMSANAVLQSATVIAGKLCYEGKLISGALDENLGIRLRYVYSGQEGSDDFGVEVFGKRPGDDHELSIKGTVRKWRTTRTGSPWANPANHESMLSYRGAREWCRRHAPRLLIGVFSDDEIEAVHLEVRAQNATLVQSLERARSAPSQQDGGFSAEGVQQALEDKRQVPMEPIKPRERDPVDREETKVAETKADVTSGQRAAQPVDSAASAPKADAGAAGSPQTAEPPQESPEPNKGEVSPGESGGADAAPVGTPADIRALLSKYNETLARATQEKSLKALAAKFWEGNGGWPPANAGLKNRASRIYAVREELLKIGTPANDEQKTQVRNLNDDLKEALAE